MAESQEDAVVTEVANLDPKDKSGLHDLVLRLAAQNRILFVSAKATGWNESARSIVHGIFKAYALGLINKPARNWSKNMFLIRTGETQYNLTVPAEQVEVENEAAKIAAVEEVIKQVAAKGKRSPEQKALRAAIMDPRNFVYRKKDHDRLLRNLKGKKGDDEDLDDGE